jgi:hypothetical protein
MSALAQFQPYLDKALVHPLLSALIATVVFSLIVFLIGRRIRLELFFRSYLFWTLTLLFALDAVRLGAFGPDAAAVVGPVPAADPVAANLSLAFAAIAFLSIGGSLGLRTAAVIGIAVQLLAPYAATIPTTELVVAHLTELAVVAIGLVMLVLQASGALSRPARLRRRPVEIDLGPAVHEVPAE